MHKFEYTLHILLGLRIHLHGMGIAGKHNILKRQVVSFPRISWKEYLWLLNIYLIIIFMLINNIHLLLIFNHKSTVVSTIDELV